VTDLYWYNALGQRMRDRLAGVYSRYVYNGDRVLEEYNDSYSGMRARHTTESGSYYTPWQSVNTSTNARFPLYDGVGSVPRLVDETGTLKYYQTLDAFRVPMTAGYGGDSPCNYERYCGAWGYLSSYTSGLTKVGARFYWPEIGRFISQDPIRDGINWYAYGGNNPAYWIDADGRNPAAVIVVIGGVAFIVYYYLAYYNALHALVHSLDTCAPGRPGRPQSPVRPTPIPNVPPPPPTPIVG